MIEAFSAADVRAAERPLLAAERGFAGGLMHRAAWALAAAVRRELRADGVRVPGAAVAGLVGGGNNGGDTLHALALLARHGVSAIAVAPGPVHDGGLAALRSAGGRVLAVGPDAPGEPVWLGDAIAEAFAADVVLDGLLGIGARGGLRGPAARLVELLGGLLSVPGPGPRVVAVDVPSGIGVDDGAVPGPVLAADRTVTFGAAKPGLLLPPAAALAGVVDVVDLGLALGGGVPGAPRAAVVRLAAPDVAALWPVPGALDHKYTRGVLGVVAGSPDYPGAAVLTVAGALGAGCPMVRYLGPAAVRDAVVAAHPEVVTAEGRVQAWVLGPGVAGGEQRERVAAVLRAAGRDATPVVVDAGALGLLPARVGGHVVLTPHAGELATLLTARGIAVGRAQVEAEPLRWAREAVSRTGATVLLKGATTLVVGTAGRAEVVASQADGTPWLATAGAGDVLAGVLGALLAGLAVPDGPLTAGPDGPLTAGPRVLVEVVVAAVAVHGWAACAASGGGPLTASAVAAALPGVVRGLVAGP